MKFTQLSAGRDRSVVLSSEGKAFGWGSVKLLGATLPPGYPGELCTSSATEIGHNRFAQPVAQWLNPGTPFASVADGYIDTLAVCRTGTVHACRPVVSSEGGAEMSPVVGLPAFAVQMVLTESAGFALYADGKVWSWGMSAYGQLGRPGAAQPEGPDVVAGLPPITSLAAGRWPQPCAGAGPQWPRMELGRQCRRPTGPGHLGAKRQTGARRHPGAHGQSGRR